jgi:hypothetical protein
MPDSFKPTKADVAFREGCRALGEVVYFFQQLEDDLRNAVSFLIDPHDSTTANIVVHEQSFKQLVALAYSLFEQYAEAASTENSNEWRSILSRAFAAENDRNALLHSTFGVSECQDPIFSRSKITAKFKKGFHEHGEALDDATMTTYRQGISSVANDICEFMGRVFPGWNTRDWKRESA